MTTGRVSANFFSLLGVPTQLGRTFEPQEGTAGNQRVAVLSAGLWRRRFGADRDILGRSLTLGDEPFTVVGVLLDGFRFQRFPDEPDLWTPIVLDPAKSPPRVPSRLTLVELVRVIQGEAIFGALERHLMVRAASQRPVVADPA